jgi:4-hydroxythreonine-4-phosphate dehydrogenase
MGDPAGVGPEVVVRAFSQPEVLEWAQCVVLGNDRALRDACETLGLPYPFREVASEDEELFADEPTLLKSDRIQGAPILPGHPDARTGRASLSYIMKATDLCLRGVADGLVTAPVSKDALRRAGCRYPGHTELIADLAGAEKVVMMLAGGGLRVALVTTHAALATVPQLATRGEVFGSLVVIDRDLRESFGLSRPRIGVLGLNPHAGEGGLFGREEEVHITPGIEEAKGRNIDATGPLPADTAFHRMLEGEFDVILAMYHDQGLGPLKTVAFDRSVNISLGLPIVRTSVGHGTAFGIAGTGRASESSLVEAIRTAASMARCRALGPPRP